MMACVPILSIFGATQVFVVFSFIWLGVAVGTRTLGLPKSTSNVWIGFVETVCVLSTVLGGVQVLELVDIKSPCLS